ncbi:hypothetical protein L1887_40283 [Cichorium endivia]|nr:hypothetical protein L1887_40283 [Cichorium endivia]
MEQKPRDKYPKAKIEEPNLRLPKTMLKPDSDSNDDLSYMMIFEDDTQRAQHLGEAIAAGAKLDRRVYRIRNQELVKFIGRDFKGMFEVHRASKATIGILADAESNKHSHAYIDLMGTVEEVTTAEGLILDNTLKTYSTLAYPVILMPPTIYWDHITIPANKVIHVLGSYRTNLLRMEMESGAWIKIESDGGSKLKKLINVFGPQKHVFKAIDFIQAVTYEPKERSAAQQELWHKFNEPCGREFFERKEAEKAKLKEKQPAEEGGSSSGGPEIEKQEEEDDVNEADADGKKCGDGESTSKVAEGEPEKKRNPKNLIIRLKKKSEKGQPAEDGGSGVTEKEKQPEHVEEAESEKGKGPTQKLVSNIVLILKLIK